MLEGLKILFAKNRVLDELAREGILSSADRKIMSSVAGNNMNYEYATVLLKTRSTGGKYAAVAAVFARIAALARSGTDTGVRPSAWVAAAHHAFELEGTDPFEVDQIVDDMMDMNDRVNSGPLI